MGPVPDLIPLRATAYGTEPRRVCQKDNKGARSVASANIKGRLYVRRLFIALLWIAASLTSARADNYPDRPITLVVPYAAGGGNDVMARIVAEKMSKSLGQQIVIENKGGAGGSSATRQVATAAADGYALGLGGTGRLAIKPPLSQHVGEQIVQIIP